jgi:amino acid transporter
MARPNQPSSDAADAAALARLGYAQALARRLGGYSSFAVGFSVISVLTGVTSTYGTGLASGGPRGLCLGWGVVAVGTLLVAVPMAELASAFPTAGALYHWSALLGGVGWGWATAMLNLVGQVAVLAAIDLACAQAIQQVLGWPDMAAYGIFAAILLLHAAINAASLSLVARLNDLSATVHVLGVAGLASLLFFRGRAHGAGYLLEGPSKGPPGGVALGFLRSLVVGVWTFTGFDAAAHLSEETHDPQRRAPVGLVTSVAVSAFAGFLLVVTLTLAIRDASAAEGAPDAALRVLRGALGEEAGRMGMVMAIVAMWFAGLSSLTSASRMLFAFARDGGLPKAEWLRGVDERTRTPAPSIVACSVAALGLVTLTAWVSLDAFLAVAALATVSLYASYALPIALGALARLRRRWTQTCPWDLGRASVPLACAAAGWALVVFVVCALADSMTIILFAALLLVLAFLWGRVVRHRFTGPPVDLSHFQR